MEWTGIVHKTVPTKEVQSYLKVNEGNFCIVEKHFQKTQRLAPFLPAFALSKGDELYEGL